VASGATAAAQRSARVTVLPLRLSAAGTTIASGPPPPLSPSCSASASGGGSIAPSSRPKASLSAMFAQDGSTDSATSTFSAAK